MNRATTTLLVLVAMVTLLVTVAGATPQPVAAQGGYFYNFEEKLEPWKAGAESALVLQRGDSACPSIGVGAAHVGNMLSLRPGYGPLRWMQASFPAKPGNTLTLTFAAKADATCAVGCTPVVYAGGAPPKEANAFHSNFASASSVEWRHYRYTTKLDSDLVDRVYVGLGVTPGYELNPSGTGLGMSFDCVGVQIDTVTDH
jgi:hypothetical protein